MIVVTGATGRTGRYVAESLLKRGEKVRAVGRDPKKLEALVGLGAEACVACVDDLASVTKAFYGSIAVYLVLPEDLMQEDLRAHQERVSDCYAAALAKTEVPFAVNLSSIGAQHAEGTGLIVGLHNQEQKLNRVARLNVLHLRVAYFMENLFMNMAPIRETGTMPGGMRGDVAMPWIATKDIGSYATACLAARDFHDSSVQELHGQRDLSMNEAASIVGQLIGKPDLSYVQLPSSVLEAALSNAGLPKKTAGLILEMWAGANAGLISPKESRSAKNTTPTTLESFVAEFFAPAYRQMTDTKPDS